MREQIINRRIIFCSMLLFFWIAAADARAETNTNVAFPEFSFVDTDGNTLTNQSLKGQTVLLIISQESCSACNLTLQDLKGADWHNTQGLRIIVACPYYRDAQAASYKQSGGYDFTFCGDENRRIGKLVVSMYQKYEQGDGSSFASPMLFIIDSTGNLRYEKVGYTNSDTLHAKLSQFVTLPPLTSQPDSTEEEEPDETLEKGDYCIANGQMFTVTNASKRYVTFEGDYSGKSAITIPSYVTCSDNKRYKVVGISDYAMMNATAKKVTIPDTVEKIGKYAFYNNKKLKTVVMGKSVTRIGDGCFSYCGKLKNMTIKSKKLKKVGKYALLDDSIKIDVPNNKRKAYKKLFKNKGQRQLKIY